MLALYPHISDATSQTLAAAMRSMPEAPRVSCSHPRLPPLTGMVASGCPEPFRRWGGRRGRAPQVTYRPQPYTVVPQRFTGSNTGHPAPRLAATGPEKARGRPLRGPPPTGPPSGSPAIRSPLVEGPSGVAARAPPVAGDGTTEATSRPHQTNAGRPAQTFELAATDRRHTRTEALRTEPRFTHDDHPSQARRTAPAYAGERRFLPRP